jgi:hypothetical protein
MKFLHLHDLAPKRFIIIDTWSTFLQYGVTLKKSYHTQMIVKNSVSPTWEITPLYTTPWQNIENYKNKK